MKTHLLVTLLILCSAVNAQNWQQTGPFGGYFKEFTIDPQNNAVIYAGSDDGGGVWKSTDFGDTWNLLTGDYPNMTGWKIVVDPTNSNTMYACDVYSRYAVLKSMDGGNNWTIQGNGLHSAYDKMVSGIAIMNTDTLLISTGEAANSDPPRPGNGVYLSTNAGNSWTATGFQDTTTTSINNNIFNTIFVGTEDHGLYYSNNFGTTWLPHPDISITSTVHEIEVKDSVIALGASDGVFLSTNYGINFTNIGLSGQFNFDIAIHSAGPNVELFSSTLSGLQKYSSGMWSIISHPELDGQIIIGIASDGSNVYASTFSNHLILKSSNGGVDWATISQSPPATELNDIILNPDNPDHIYTAMMGSYNIGAAFNKSAIRMTTDGGTTWQDAGPDAHGLVLKPNPLNPNTIYLGTFSSGLFKSYDGFNTYQNLVSGNKLVGDITICPNDTNTILISEVLLPAFIPSVKRSTDGGNSFSSVANAIVANRLLFHPTGCDTAWAATADGLYRSTDNGQSWQAWLLNNQNLLSLYFANNKLYTGSEQGELYEIDHGIVTNISGGWPTPVEIKSIYSVGDHLFAGLSGAESDSTHHLHGSIWESIDQGNSWTSITAGMTSTNVYGNNIIASDGNDLFVGTYGGGIFKSTDLNLSVNKAKPETTVKIYPNPGKSVVYIEVESENIEQFQVINMVGQDVTYSVPFKTINKQLTVLDISKLSSGSYNLVVNGQQSGLIVKQ